MQDSHSEMTIGRGSIVRVQNDRSVPFYFVYAVYCNNRWKKWFLTRNFPAWPATDTDKKRVRLGIREIVVLYDRDGKKAIEWKKDLVDGKNVPKIFKLATRSRR